MSTNEEVLQAKIAKMKEDIKAQEGKMGEEKKRMKVLFDQFDTNKDGELDIKEFRLLAYECGIQIEELAKDKIEQTYASLAGGKKLDFEAFFAYVFRNSGNGKSMTPALVKLRMKMASKSFTKVLGAGLKLDDVKIPDIPAGGKERVAEFKVGVGSFGEAKSGIYVDICNDSKKAAANINSVEDFPEGVTTFAYVDFPVKDDIDHMKAAKAAGMIETAIGMGISMVAGKMPISQFLKETSVNICEQDGGKKVIRIAAFCAVDPKAMAKQKTGLDLTQIPGDLATFAAKLELPVSLDTFAKDKDAKLTEDILKFRAHVRCAVKQSAIEACKNLLPKLPFVNDIAWFFLYLFKFFESFNLDLSFRAPSDFVKGIPDDLPEYYHTKIPRRIKANYGKIMEMAQSKAVAGWAAMAAGMVSGMKQNMPPMVGQYYDLVKNLTTGLDGARVHVQSGDTMATVNLKGFNFAQFLL